MNEPTEYLGYQISVETSERRISSSQRVWSARFQLSQGSEVIQRYAQACDGQKSQYAAVDKALRFARIAIDVRVDVRVAREQRMPGTTRKGQLDRITRDLSAVAREMAGADN